MIDPDLYIRKAFGDCIGTVTYNGDTIPVFDTFSDEDEGKYQIILSSLNRINADDKCTFDGDYTFVVDIITRTINSGNRFIADAISTQITAKIQPDRTTSGPVIDSQFQLLNLRLDGSDYLNEGTKANFIVRKLLRYRFRIVQK